MTRPTINDAGIEREMTEREHAEWLKLVADIEARAAAIESAAAAKTSARAKLKALGLTDDEIAALVG